MTVVFVHGVPETRAVWDALRGSLDQDSVALALPGFGRARSAPFTAGKDAYAEWLTAELQRIPGPVDLVGHDWGALLCYRVITSGEVTVRSWVADVANIMDPRYVWHDLAQVWQTPEDGEAFMRQILTADVDAPDSVAGSLRALGMPDAAARTLHHSFDAVMGDAILDLYRSAQPNPYADWGDRLHPTPAPGLVVVAENDPFDDLTLATATAHRLGARIHVLKGAGHFWMAEDPSAAAMMLTDFWASAIGDRLR